MSDATPWRLAGPHSDGSNTVVAADGSIICALMPREAKHGPSIVRAVNAYDEMLAALRAVAENFFEHELEPGGSISEDAIDAVRALIAKADGKS